MKVKTYKTASLAVALCFISFITKPMKEEPNNIVQQSINLATEIIKPNINMDKVKELIKNGASTHLTFAIDQEKNIRINIKEEIKSDMLLDFKKQVTKAELPEDLIEFILKQEEFSVFAIALSKIARTNIPDKNAIDLIKELINKDKYHITTTASIPFFNPNKQKYHLDNIIVYATKKVTKKNVTKMKKVIKKLATNPLYFDKSATPDKKSTAYKKHTFFVTQAITSVFNSTMSPKTKQPILEALLVPLYKSTMNLFLYLQSPYSEQNKKNIILALDKGARYNALITNNEIQFIIDRSEYKFFTQRIFNYFSRNIKRKKKTFFEKCIQNITHQKLSMIALELASKNKNLAKNALAYFTYIKENKPLLFKEKFQKDDALIKYALQLWKTRKDNIEPIATLLAPNKIMQFKTIEARRKIWIQKEKEKEDDGNGDGEKEKENEKEEKENDEDEDKDEDEDEDKDEDKDEDEDEDAGNGDGEKEVVEEDNFDGDGNDSDANNSDGEEEVVKETVEATQAPTYWQSYGQPVWNGIKNTPTVIWNGVKATGSWIGEQLTKLKFW